MVRDYEPQLQSLRATFKELRRLPRLDLRAPLVVLVGMPNVGKSSIVSAISTGNPAVRHYPFTTRTAKVGHMYLPCHKTEELERLIANNPSSDNSTGHSPRADRLQVIDTPGVLDRNHEERNTLERLTLASVQHIPSTVVFVTDSTGTSQSLDSQLRVRAEVRQIFENRTEARPTSDFRDDLNPSDNNCRQNVRWIDVLSKVDLRAVTAAVTARSSPGGVSAKMSGGQAEMPSSETWIDRAIGVSCVTGEGLDNLSNHIVDRTLQGIRGTQE